ncbi:unnamed protein product [Trichobilharzia regenti]|nr:unnamed protein product [Trichobilharzia regenti]
MGTWFEPRWEQIGSGWGGTADVNLSNQAARPNYPPPPYPGYPSSSPPPITDDPTVNPSAPRYMNRC